MALTGAERSIEVGSHRLIRLDGPLDQAQCAVELACEVVCHHVVTLGPHYPPSVGHSKRLPIGDEESPNPYCWSAPTPYDPSMPSIKLPPDLTVSPSGIYTRRLLQGLPMSALFALVCIVQAVIIAIAHWDNTDIALTNSLQFVAPGIVATLLTWAMAAALLPARHGTLSPSRLALVVRLLGWLVAAASAALCLVLGVSYVAAASFPADMTPAVPSASILTALSVIAVLAGWLALRKISRFVDSVRGAPEEGDRGHAEQPAAGDH